MQGCVSSTTSGDAWFDLRDALRVRLLVGVRFEVGGGHRRGRREGHVLGAGSRLTRDEYLNYMYWQAPGYQAIVSVALASRKGARGGTGSPRTDRIGAETGLNLAREGWDRITAPGTAEGHPYELICAAGMA